MRERGITSVANRIHDASELIGEDDCLAARRELAGVRARHETVLICSWSDGALSEGEWIFSNKEQPYISTEAAARRNNRARRKRVINRAAEFPTADVHGEGVRVAQPNILLCLVAVGGIEIANFHREVCVRDLADGNSRSRTQRSRREKSAATGQVGINDPLRLWAHLLRCICGELFSSIRPPTPLGEIQIRVRCANARRVNQIEQFKNAIFIRAQIDWCRTGLKDFIHQCPHAAQKGLVQLRIVENDVLEIVEDAKLKRLIGVDVVIEIARTAQPIMTKCKVCIPR